MLRAPRARTYDAALGADLLVRASALPTFVDQSSIDTDIWAAAIRREQTASVLVRDPKVREAVLKRTALDLASPGRTALFI